MEKQIIIPTPDDLKLIDEYIEEQDFWKNNTKDDVMSLFLVLIGYGLEPQKAINNIASIVASIKNEYGD